MFESCWLWQVAAQIAELQFKRGSLLTNIRCVLVGLWNGRENDSREIFWQRELGSTMLPVLWPKDEKKSAREAKNRCDRNTFLQIIFGHFSGKHSLFIVSLRYSVEQFIFIELISARNIKRF